MSEKFGKEFKTADELLAYLICCETYHQGVKYVRHIEDGVMKFYIRRRLRSVVSFCSV